MEWTTKWVLWHSLCPRRASLRSINPTVKRLPRWSMRRREPWSLRWAIEMPRLLGRWQHVCICFLLHYYLHLYHYYCLHLYHFWWPNIYIYIYIFSSFTSDCIFHFVSTSNHFNCISISFNPQLPLICLSFFPVFLPSLVVFHCRRTNERSDCLLTKSRMWRRWRNAFFLVRCSLVMTWLLSSAPDPSKRSVRLQREGQLSPSRKLLVNLRLNLSLSLSLSFIHSFCCRYLWGFYWR